MAAMVVLLRFWQPKSIWRFDHETNSDPASLAADKFDQNIKITTKSIQLSNRTTLIAWMPWILLSVFVFLWGLPQVKTLLNSFAGISIIKFRSRCCIKLFTEQRQS